MKKKCVILVDNSNIFIEGQKFSAKKKGISQADGRLICDPSWRIDFGQLISIVADKQDVVKAVLVGSTPPQTDSIWEAAKRGGFQVITHSRNLSGKEKKVDTEIVAQGTKIICRLAYTNEDNEVKDKFVLKLLSGDSDFIPLVKVAEEEGWETEMWAFSSSFNSSGEMAQTVSSIKPLDNIFEQIGKNEFEWNG